MTSVICRFILVPTEYLDGRRASDTVALGEMLICHDIDSSKLDWLIGKRWITLSSFILGGKWLTVGAPISIEGDQPHILIIIDDCRIEV